MNFLSGRHKLDFVCKSLRPSFSPATTTSPPPSFPLHYYLVLLSILSAVPSPLRYPQSHYFFVLVKTIRLVFLIHACNPPPPPNLHHLHHHHLLPLLHHSPHHSITSPHLSNIFLFLRSVPPNCAKKSRLAPIPSFNFSGGLIILSTKTS